MNYHKIENMFYSGQIMKYHKRNNLFNLMGGNHPFLKNHDKLVLR